MAGPRLTMICHFRNEEVYLPHWLRHHTQLFDHGVMIDYRSTDRSLEVIRELAPTWEVRPTRNAEFYSVAIDKEVMDVEATLPGWKMCLNATEFVLHDDLRGFVAEFERLRPDAPGLVTTGFIVQDAPDQVGQPLTDAPLWEQRHFGCPEPDPFHGATDRRRLLHKAVHGAYGIGRHSNGVSMLQDPPLYLLWYGWCPLALKLERNRSTKPMVSSMDWGSHHVLTEDTIRDIWRTKYLPRCHDLLDGRHPGLTEMVERLRRRDAGLVAAAVPAAEPGVQFTVVVNVYGPHRDLLPRALTGLLNQTCRDFEVVVVVDGDEPLGPYDPAELCRQTVPARVVYRPASDTAGNRERHHALTLAHGAYVVWLNADNLVYPDWLARHAANLERHPGTISVVNVQYWRGPVYRGVLPVRLAVGEMDLLNFALPLALARRHAAFGPAVEHLRYADWLAFAACAQDAPVVWDPDQPPCACHY